MKTMTKPVSHASIRRAARIFEAARLPGDDADAGPAWRALGETIAMAGYAAAIVGGTFYLASSLVPELADRDDEFGDQAFRASLILDLDQVDGVAR